MQNAQRKGNRMFRISGVIIIGAAAVAAGASAGQVDDLVLSNAFFPQLESLGGVGGGSDIVLDMDMTPDGSRMVVATPSESGILCDPLLTSGVLYIYDYNPVTRVWDEIDRVAPGCGNFGVGNELAISDDGSTIIAGSRPDNNGLVVILEEINGEFVPTFTIDPNPPFDLPSNIGTSLDLDSGGEIAIAANMPNSGTVEIYRKSSGAWTLAQTLTTNVTPVATDGGWAAVGTAVANPNLDILRLYRDTGSSFVQTQTVNVPFIRGLGIASRIELDGDVIAIVTPKTGGQPQYVGVRIIERDPGTDTWAEVFVDKSVDFLTQGLDVDIDGDTVVVGAKGAGQIRVYERTAGQWGLSRVIDAFSPDGNNLQIVDQAAVGGGRIVYGGRVLAGTNNAPGGRAYVLEYGQPNFIGPFTEDFDGLSELPPTLWQRPRNNRSLAVISDELVLGATTPGVSNAQLALGNFLEGDFDVSIDWEVDEVAPLQGGLAFLAVSELLAFAGGNTMWVQRSRTLNSSTQPGTDYYKSFDSILGGDNLNSSLSGVTDSTAGSYRITRHGTTWRTFYSDANNPDWVQLREATLSGEPAGFAFGSASNGNYITGEVRWDNLVVRIPCLADVNGDGVANPADFNAWIFAFNNQTPGCDQNGDSVCDPADFNAWILNFNNGCP